jgi:4-azaleucine resistance transporter AzlC
LGIAFGLMLNDAGYSFLWAFFSSVFIYAGSGQFALAGFLADGANFLTAALMTLYINSRHIFYGLSFIEKFKSMGRSGLYMIFSLTDETYSLLHSTAVPPELDEHKTLLYIAALDHSYWVIGSTLGAFIGQLNFFSSEGVDFAMTALFVVIFIEQWLESKNRFPALVGALCAVSCFVIAGPKNFILPALLTAVAALILLRFLRPGKEAKA